MGIFTPIMKTLGRIDKIDIPEFGLKDIPVKIDTGANRSTIHCSHIRHVDLDDGTEEITFEIPIEGTKNGGVFHSNHFFKKRIRSSSGHVEERYIIKTTVVLFGKRYKTTFSLSDRSDMNYPILLGRRLLKGKFLIDVSQENLSFNSKSE